MGEKKDIVVGIYTVALFQTIVKRLFFHGFTIQGSHSSYINLFNPLCVIRQLLYAYLSFSKSTPTSASSSSSL